MKVLSKEIQDIKKDVADVKKDYADLKKDVAYVNKKSEENEKFRQTIINTIDYNPEILKRFVNFHWDHYQHEPRFIPLLDYEFLLDFMSVRLVSSTRSSDVLSVFHTRAISE